MKGRTITLILLLCIAPVPWTGVCTVSAQNMQDEFDSFLSSITSEFYTYLDSIDLEFALLLEDEWQEFMVYEGEDPPLYASSSVVTLPKEGRQVSTPVGQQSARSSFYGQPVTLSVAQRPPLRIGSFSEKNVADAWRVLFQYDFTSLLLGVNRYCKALTLNDWGKYKLISHIVDDRFSFPLSGERTLLLSYLLIHAGIHAKMAVVDSRLSLLLPFEEDVYQQSYIKLDGVKYYLTENGRVQKLLTSVHNYPKDVGMLSLAINAPFTFQERLVRSEKTGNPVVQDKNLLDFYDTWPLCDLSVYAKAKPSRTFKDRLDTVLLQEMSTKGPLEQVAFLLNWVQQATTHKPDTDVHGQEKYYFPEETLYYPFADCEDLSVLLHWLIRTYTSCQPVLLLYDDHVACGIERPDGYEGTVLSWQGRQYIICDPSYKGAGLGQVVPVYNSKQPRVVSYQ